MAAGVEGPGTGRSDWGGLLPQWGAVAFTGLLSLALSSVLGRTLGPKDFGILSYALSFAAILAVLQDGGFRTLLFREKASRREGGEGGLGPLLGRALRYTAGVTLVLAGFTLLLPLEDRGALCLALVLTGLGAVSGYVSSLLKGRGLFSREALWQVLTRVFTAGAVLAALAVTRRVEWILSAWSLGLALAFLTPPGMGTLAGEIRRPSVKGPAPGRRTLLAFLAIDAATLVYFRCDMVLLPYLAADRAETGIYASAYRILEGAILAATPAAHMFFRIVRRRWTGGERVASYFFRGVGAMALAGALSGAAGFLLGPPVLSLLFGSDFSRAGPVLQTLSLSLLFILPNFFLTQGALAFDLEWPYAFSAAGTAGVNVALNFLLIPRLGAEGAAWATFASEGMLGAALLFFLVPRLRRGVARGGGE